MVTGDSQEEVMIFRYTQTLHHNIYIIIETIKISVVINTKVIAINLNSSPETRMENRCAMPAVFITNYTT